MSITMKQSYLLGTSPPELPIVAPAILRKRVMTSQPQYAAQIDWSNPITRGLFSGANFAYGNAALARSTSNKSLAITNGIRGVNASGAAISASGVLKVQGDVSIGAEFTALIVCSPTTTGTQVFLSGGSSAGLWVGIGAGNWTTGQAAILSKNNVYVIKRTSSNYIQGCLNGGALSSETYNSTAFSTGNYIFGSYGGNSYQISGSANLFLIWNRALSTQEIKSLSDNPYQIFLAPNAQPWVATP